jgi:dTDP-4-amino-4,6-dideoxygalactose transaminase
LRAIIVAGGRGARLGPLTADVPKPLSRSGRRIQLGRLPADREQRRRLTRTCRELLSEQAPQVSVPFSRHQGGCAYHLMVVVLPEGKTRVGVQEYLRDRECKLLCTTGPPTSSPTIAADPTCGELSG